MVLKRVHCSFPRHPAEAADFLRVHVTQIYGGWWLDADIRVRDQDALNFMATQTAGNVFFAHA